MKSFVPVHLCHNRQKLSSQAVAGRVGKAKLIMQLLNKTAPPT